MEHQNFINELESYLLREYLEVQLDGKPIELGEAIDLYKQTTLNPIAINSSIIIMANTNISLQNILVKFNCINFNLHFPPLQIPLLEIPLFDLK